MTTFIIIIILFIGLWGCEKEQQKRNPYLGEVHFTYTIDLNQPLYNSLKTPMNTVFVPYGGIRGFFVIYNGSSYYAWEAACPNHSLDGCYSRLYGVKTQTDEDNYENTKLHNYIYVRCSCDKTTYLLGNGTPITIGDIAKPYPLLNYRVSVSGSSLTISN